MHTFFLLWNTYCDIKKIIFFNPRCNCIRPMVSGFISIKCGFCKKRLRIILMLNLFINISWKYHFEAVDAMFLEGGGITPFSTLRSNQSFDRTYWGISRKITALTEICTNWNRTKETDICIWCTSQCGKYYNNKNKNNALIYLTRSIIILSEPLKYVWFAAKYFIE